MIYIRLLLNKWTLIIASAITIFLLLKTIHNQRQEIKRQSSNYDVLVGEKSASDQALMLTKKELSKVIEQDQQIQRALKDSLKIKDKQVQKLSKSTTRTQINFKTVLVDSVVLHDSVRLVASEALKTFKFKDTWNSVRGMIVNDSISMKIQTVDTLVIVDYRYKEGKWFLSKIFKKWKSKMNVVNSNPSASYHISTRIEKVK